MNRDGIKSDHSQTQTPVETQDTKKVAIVFIHGIGIQDRYQQLVSFTKGLRYTPKAGEFQVDLRGSSSTPQARFIPIKITEALGSCDYSNVEADVHEVYWSPLLNGLTNWTSVLRWVGITAWRSVPLNRPDIPPRPLTNPEPDSAFLNAPHNSIMKVNRELGERRGQQKVVYRQHRQEVKSTSGLKWFYEGGYIGIAAIIVLLAMWWVFGALLLAIDQISNPRYAIIHSASFLWEAPEGSRTDFQPSSRDWKELMNNGPKRKQNYVASQRRRMGATFDFWQHSLYYLRERETILAEIALYTEIETQQAKQREAKQQAKAKQQKVRQQKAKAKQQTTPRAEAKRKVVMPQVAIIPPAISPLRFTSPTVAGLSLDTAKILSKLEVRDLIVGALYLFSLFWTCRYVFDVLALLWQMRKVVRREHGATSSSITELNRSRLESLEEMKQLMVGLAWRCLSAMLLFLLTLTLAEMSKLIVTLLLIPLVVSLLLRNALKAGLTEIIGDVQIYVTRNENSQFFQGREAVLKRSLETLQEILDSSQYDRVYLACHSLGSVIGLDTLRRLYTQYALAYQPDVPSQTRAPVLENYEKIKGFITFGSPLEKTLLFFYQNDYKSQFEEFSRVVDWRIFDETEKNATRPTPRPHCIPWFNFWIWTDIVCDPLTSYPVTKHHQVQIKGHWNLWSHSDYWQDSLFVRNILRILTWNKPNDFHQMELTTDSTFPPSPEPNPEVAAPDLETVV